MLKHFYYYRNMNIQNAVVCPGCPGPETRLQVFRLLVQAGEEEGWPSGALPNCWAPNQWPLSFHLKELVNAGLAHVAPGRAVHLLLGHYPAMNELLACLTEQCCGGQPMASPVPVCPAASSKFFPIVFRACR